jgi:hypothetical protein
VTKIIASGVEQHKRYLRGFDSLAILLERLKMHEPYDDYDDYYNDDYDDSHEYDKSQSDWNKFYFKFDINSSPLSDWVQKMTDNIFKGSSNKDININNWDYNISYISGFPFVSLPVNNWPQNTGDGLGSTLYLGVNYQNEPIWKKKYFIIDKTQNDYVNHLSANAVHFVKQPSYYKGLYDILN